MFKLKRSGRWRVHKAGGSAPRVLAIIILAGAVAASTLALAPTAANATGSRPCDSYAGASTPCVAAYSTTRALLTGYSGNLYQVERSSDNATLDIPLLATGDYANASTQDSFCAATKCTIVKIYDQTSQHNDLSIEVAAGVPDFAARADALPAQAGGHKVYGLYTTYGVGYRKTSASGVATNGQPEGMYMVTSGHTANGGCCFDFGNVENVVTDTGASHMDALNFSTFTFGGTLAGDGPWVEADLENGVFPGSTANTGNSSRFVTAVLKNDGQTTYALKGGDSQSGGLTSWFEGALPSGYSPMHQEGSIVLGTGGDNGAEGTGSFFEGVMTSGYPSNATDAAVQADIVGAGYAATGDGTTSVGSELSLITPAGLSVRHNGDVVAVSSVAPDSAVADRAAATFGGRPGLADSSCVSFDSRDNPGFYLRHSSGVIHSVRDDHSGSFAQDSTFCPGAGKNGTGTSFSSYNYPTNYLRVSNGSLYIAPNDGSSWANDVTFAVSTPWLNKDTELSLVTPSGASVRHSASTVSLSTVTSASSASDRADATFVIRAGLADASCLSFESRNTPGSYLRHSSGLVSLVANDHSGLFAQDSTFCPKPGKNGSGTSYASYNYPTNFLRVFNGAVYIAPNGGPYDRDTTVNWNDDVTFNVRPPWF